MQASRLEMPKDKTVVFAVKILTAGIYAESKAFLPNE